MAILKYIVWGSAGYYDTGNELASSVVGPFGFEHENEAKAGARAMSKACEAHVNEQADEVDSNDDLKWNGPFLWYVATLQLPEPIEWDGVDPFGRLKAHCAEHGGKASGVRKKRPDFREKFIDQCDLVVDGGQRDEDGDGDADVHEMAEMTLWDALG